MPAAADEDAFARLAYQQEVTVYPLSALRLTPTQRPGVMLDFSAFNEAAIKEGVQKLALAWRR